MTDKEPHHQAYLQAIARQAEATSPLQSVFVSANAGTGKTHVLTNRVLRLLLTGTPPDSILCVTYTKAAAAEMRHRLSERLKRWAICPQEELIHDLKQMGEASPTQEHLHKARELFAYILDFGDSPQIDTLHAFCQRILRRFPLEAEIPPFFELIEEDVTSQMMHDSLMKVIESAYQTSSPLLRNITFLLNQGLDNQLLELTSQILSNRKMIAALAAEPLGVEAFAKRLETECQFTPPDKLNAVLSQAVQHLSAPDSDLRLFATQLQDGGLRLSRMADALLSWCAMDDEMQVSQIELLFGAVFKKTDGGRLNYSDKKTQARWGDTEALADRVISQIEALRVHTQSAEIYRYSVALCDLALHLFRQYQRDKRAKSALDFDDLIFCAEQLLSKSEIMAWVRFKLDQGLDHILLDEAQDTSPSQWALINQLTESFFDGSEKDTELDRSLFVVGDYKQSIYSFQGAKPALFVEKKESYHRQAEQAQKPFSALQFGMSFRSSEAVLKFVDALMTARGEDISNPLWGLGSTHTAHQSYKHTMPGLVEVRTHTRLEQPKSETAPFEIPDTADTDQADLAHATSVATQVKALIEGSHNEQLGRVVTPSDILILVKKRNRFYALLRAQLEAMDIPFAGADRIKLNNQIEILDLLALGDVCLLPQDDLQLACLLKSPLIGLDEETLYTLAHNRTTPSLFDALRSHDGADTPLGKAASQLRHWLALAEKKPVFEFYSEVLNTGGRQKLYQRLGGVIDDSVNMFLQKARDGGQQGRNGLHAFLTDFRRTSGEIKREFDIRTRDEVRVMSIHGAKGLQAPIVFLPDTLKDRPVRDQIYHAEVGPIYASSAGADVPALKALKSEQDRNDTQEADRLLYVALTRAEQALFISGWEKPRNRTYEKSWLEHIDEVKDRLEGAEWIDEQCWQLSSGTAQDTSAADNRQRRHAATDADAEAPEWFFQPPQPEPLPAKPLSPSDLVESGYATEFSHADRQSALQIGQFAHKLFEILPQYADPSQRQRLAQAIKTHMLKTPSAASSRLDQQAEKIISDITGILEDERFSALFSSDALVEVSVSGLVGHLPVAGKIDRMVIDADTVTILDFKTGRPVHDPSDVSAGYAAQMAAYGALMQQIYPSKTIRCYLLWTQNQSLTEIPASQRQQIITQLLSDPASHILNS